MITLIINKILWNLPAFQQKLTKDHFYLEAKLLEFSANVKDHNFGIIKFKQKQHCFCEQGPKFSTMFYHVD